MKRSPLLWFGLTLLLAILFATIAPLEKTLGTNARFVYFHGAWVWAGMLSFLAASVMGLLALILRRTDLHRWSQTWGRVGLIYWVLFLPMSLAVMQLNWGGLFLDEPRWQIPLNLAIVGVLLQIGLSFFPLQWTSIGNLLFGFLFFGWMRGTDAVLHPDSPIFNSDARGIQIFFFGLVLILTISAYLIAQILLNWQTQRDRSGESH
jgi:hypothetical protein